METRTASPSPNTIRTRWSPVRRRQFGRVDNFIISVQEPDLVSVVRQLHCVRGREVVEGVGLDVVDRPIAQTLGVVVTAVVLLRRRIPSNEHARTPTLSPVRSDDVDLVDLTRITNCRCALG